MLFEKIGSDNSFFVSNTSSPYFENFRLRTIKSHSSSASWFLPIKTCIRHRALSHSKVWQLSDMPEGQYWGNAPGRCLWQFTWRPHIPRSSSLPDIGPALCWQVLEDSGWQNCLTRSVPSLCLDFYSTYAFWYRNKPPRCAARQGFYACHQQVAQTYHSLKWKC